MDDTVYWYILIYVFVPQFFRVLLAESASCIKNSTDQVECCADYRNVSGRCEACIGSWGKGCANSCHYGFYGHGCRQTCNCSGELQICDSKIGCTDRVVMEDLDRTEHIAVLAIFIPLTCLLVFLLFGAFLNFHRFIENSEKQRFRRGERSRASANQLHDHTEHTNYNDIRESLFINSHPRNVATVCRISSTYFSKDCQRMNMDENQSTQDMLKPTHSETMSSTEYESCFKEMEGYNRIELKSQVPCSVNDNMYE